MRERIIGVETEYSLSHIPEAGKPRIDSSDLSESAVEVAFSTFSEGADDSSSFWPNGGRLYFDVGHVEWATPECRGAREALVYDKAGDTLIGRTAEAMESQMGLSGSHEAIFAAKNNVDAHDRSFGTHENYLVARNTSVIPDSNEFFDYLARVLVPFLVSRTIICGSGMVRDGFQISQRASYINSVASSDTRRERPIINTRDEPHADATLRRRLHLILGDANMAEWATFLKLGTTSLILSMAEDVFLDSLPELRSPVSALKSISNDVTLNAAVQLTSGKSATAIEIQRWYLEAARSYLEHPEGEEEEILERWSQVLSELAREPKLTIGKLDWTTKKDLMERQVSRAGAWDDDVLKALDFRYHSLRSESSVYKHLVDGGVMERLTRPEEIERAIKEPPPFTRARIRALAMRYGAIPSDWADLEVGNDEIRLDDPFNWAPVDELLSMGVEPGEVFACLSGADDLVPVEVRVQALAGLAELAKHSSSSLESRIGERLISALTHSDRRVRLAAVTAMSIAGPARFQAPLRQAAQDIDYRVRFAAEAALGEG